MGVIARHAERINSLNMTLAARLPQHNACVEVDLPFNGWTAAVASCPNCRNELRVTVSSIPGKRHAAHNPHSPLTPPFTFEPSYFPAQSPHYGQPCPALLPSSYNKELKRLGDTLKALRLSGWYYSDLDLQGAISLLKDASIGSFVVRDSGDRKFIFSLSVQTDRGPTSVRLHYESGYFRLDCDSRLARLMPRFQCVVELVQYYTHVGERAAAGTVWVNREGCPHSPVLLKNPYRKSPPSLLHSARLAVHKALDSNPLKPKLWCAPKHRLLPLPSTLIDYLGEYPYSI